MTLMVEPAFSVASKRRGADMFVCMVFAFIGGLAGHAVALAFNEASQ